MYQQSLAGYAPASFSKFHFSHALFLAAALCVSQMACATSVIAYTFDDGGGGFINAPDTIAAGLSASAWSDLHGSLTDFAGNPERAIAAKNWNLDGNTFMFDITVPDGFMLALDSFSFDHKASSSGPLDWSLSIADLSVASGSTATSFTSESGFLSMTGLVDTFSVILAGSGASSASGTWRVDNFVFGGSVQPVATVPVPNALLLLGSALTFGGIFNGRGNRRQA